MCLGHYVHVAFQDAVLRFGNVANFYLLLISLILFRSNEQYMQFYNINTKEKYVPSDKNLNFTLFIILAVVTVLIFPATLKYNHPTNSVCQVNTIKAGQPS